MDLDKFDLIRFVGKIGNQLIEERKNIDEKIIVQTTISRLIAKITEEIEIYKINRDSVEQDMKNH